MDSDDYRFEEDNELSASDIIYGSAENEVLETAEIIVPPCVKNIFRSKRKNLEFLNFSEIERGKWDTQLEYLLSLIGYAVGLGNVWRFPGKVYQGGGGSFLVLYVILCFLFGCPVMMLEMSLGQFSGQGCSKAFDFCPFFSGLGYTIIILTFITLTSYTMVVGWCLLYFIHSFKFVLPWSVCTNSFNTPLCINSSDMRKNLTNLSYESSAMQFWNLYVTSEQNPDGSFVKITDPLGTPNVASSFCIFLVLCVASTTIMFGVRVSGKIIYITVLFPYIILLQFIVLGCTLPGAFKGIKYYLYPKPSKLLDPHVYLMAIEQLLFSIGIGTGALITMSSFNRFREKIQLNTLILMSIDFFTSFFAGFATFPVLGYISYRSGKEIEDLVTTDSSLFFLTYPEALATISDSNLWSMLFMFMAFTLGIGSLFVLLDTIVLAISDIYPVLHKKNHKIMLTLCVSFLLFFCGISYTTPNGLNWLAIYDKNCPAFILTFIVMLEVLTVLGIYGKNQFQHDIWLMNGENISSFWIISLSVFVPLFACIIWILVIKENDIITRNRHAFPKWTRILGWVLNCFILSPIFIVPIQVIIHNRTKHPNIGVIQILKLSFRPLPYYGPRTKQFWTESVFYSKKLIRYKDNKQFLDSFSKEENIVKLLKLAQLKIDEEIERLHKTKEEENEEEYDDENVINET